MRDDQNCNTEGILEGVPGGKPLFRGIVDTAPRRPGDASFVDDALTPVKVVPVGATENDPFPSLSTYDLEDKAQLPSFQVLGVRVHAVHMSEAVDRLRSLIDGPRTTTHYVAVTAMHVIAEARRDDHFRLILNNADLCVPDGMPLVWLGRLQGFPLQRRVCGAELMESFCRATGPAYRHFFFGGTEGVAEKLANVLHEKYGIVVAGTYTPPFRSLTDVEEEELASIVSAASPDVFWVGLSSPKQENWIYGHRHKISVPVMLPVGAAFDMNSGKSQRAPAWMRENGLEWLYRLCSEPGRLWKRYLITIPQTMWFVGMDLLQSSRARIAPR
jgi:N-acetylglucosaminyldiphosphoundecaprenol N-acetyl-beta-D-mannosaminyltransferase